mmetsp:Transcript_107685/g.310006  ORF Transcript_107685/g.310006 Transcript_107685/m.310006 type:complete len:266 (+) Transcript_107685:1298-2095(+)
MEVPLGVLRLDRRLPRHIVLRSVLGYGHRGGVLVVPYFASGRKPRDHRARLPPRQGPGQVGALRAEVPRPAVDEHRQGECSHRGGHPGVPLGGAIVLRQRRKLAGVARRARGGARGADGRYIQRHHPLGRRHTIHGHDGYRNSRGDDHALPGAEHLVLLCQHLWPDRAADREQTREQHVHHSGHGGAEGEAAAVQRRGRFRVADRGTPPIVALALVPQREQHVELYERRVLLQLWGLLACGPAHRVMPPGGIRADSAPRRPWKLC